MYWFLSILSFSCLCSKWYRGSEDSMLCTLYSNIKFWFVHVPWGASLFLFRTMLCSYHNISFCPIGSLDLLIACFIRWSFLLDDISLQSLILNMVWLPPNIFIWISAYVSTPFMRNAHFGEEFSLCWLFKLFIHFGTLCQWGRSLEGLREMVLFLSLVCA